MRLLLLFLLLTTTVSADNLITGFDVLEEGIYDNVEDTEIGGNAGITPDSPLYALENLIENILVGKNPKTALKYKEEKILEVKQMIEDGKSEAASKALERVEKYNNILKKEVTPEIEEKVRQSSKASKKILESFNLEGNEWEDVKETIKEKLKDEDKIALAAKVSKTIKQLCETLSELDPLEYSKRCKTDEDSPKWKKDLDNKLTKDQEKEAKQFFGIMSECFKSPDKCRCDDISIKPFAEKCKVIAPLAAKCEAGDEEACEKMEDVEDPIKLLPDYLQNVMDDVEDKYGDSKHDLHTPKECVKEGALTRESCMKVMFKLHAPEPCQKALEAGKLNIKNENEARKACEQIMFKEEAPKECIEAGIKNFRECERHMFKIDAPEECITAGLTGESKNDRQQCEKIRFKLDAPKECIEAGIDGSNRDDWKKCELIRFKLDAPQACLDAGITGENRNDWKKCDVINFKNEAHEDCLKAGLTGEGRDDWKKCQVIQFKAEQPKECLDAGLDGSSRNDHRECDKIRFKLDAPKECIDAGIDGSGRDDWRKCDKIKFKLEAPKECLDRGLDGSGRRDWDECNKIRNNLENKQHNDVDCATILCPKGTDCINGKGCVSNECDNCREKCNGKAWDCSNGDCKCQEDSECKDGCHQECPNADRTDCVNDRCECYYEEKHEQSGNDYVDECSTCADKCGDRSWSCNDNQCECHEQSSNDYVDECSTCADKCGDRSWSCNDNNCQCGDNPDSGSNEPDDTNSNDHDNNDATNDQTNTGDTSDNTDQAPDNTEDTSGSNEPEPEQTSEPEEEPTPSEPEPTET